MKDGRKQYPVSPKEVKTSLFGNPCLYIYNGIDRDQFISSDCPTSNSRPFCGDGVERSRRYVGPVRERLETLSEKEVQKPIL